MNWLPGVKRQKVRKAGRAQVSVESMEERALLTGLGLLNTLNARDTINIQELNVIQSIQQSQLTETAQFQQVIANGQARTNSLANELAVLAAQEAAQRQAGDVAGVLATQAQERLVFASGAAVRSLMRQATVVNNTVQATLLKNTGAVITTFNNVQNNLAAGNNPFLSVPHAVTALNFLGLQAAQHAAAGAAALTAIDAQINGPLFLPPGLPG
jgi:hypothetical protein